MKKKCFTVSEILVAAALLITVVALLVPSIKKIMPDSNKEKIRHTYLGVMSVIGAMIADPYVYPTATFTNTSRVTLQNGESYGGTSATPTASGSKFADFFKSKLNVMVDGLAIADASKIPNICDSANVCDYTRSDTCFRTNNNIIYCIPVRTWETLPSSAQTSGYIVIRVYFESPRNADDADKSGFYITVDSMGKVGILSPSLVLFTSEDGSNQGIQCSDNAIYKNYNQCKMNDYLLDVKNTKE